MNNKKSKAKELLKFNFHKKVCPICKKHKFRFDSKDYVVYCLECGLVVQATYNYTNGNKFNLEFGLL